MDAGTTHHHRVVIDAEGRRLLARRVAYDELDLIALISDVTALADRVTWAVDLPDGGAALLGAEFLAATGGDMTFYTTPNRLAAFAGLAPWDSGRIRGNLHRPRHYHRGRNRVFCSSAMISIRTCPDSRRFYDCGLTKSLGSLLAAVC